jgi:hypothetical protein
MRYRIIITKDGKKKKVVHKSDNLKTIQRKYNKIRDNNKVLTPKKTNAYKKVKPVKYEILLLKEYEKGDVGFFDRDEMGRTTELKDVSKKWTILHKDEYFYEESFTVFGQDKRIDTKKIIRLFILKKHKSIVVKQVNYIKNKLLIHQDGDFDIVLCKCPDDAKRLYNILREFCEVNNINNIIFTGSVGKRNSVNTYNMIEEKTGWSRNKVYRTTTRP